MLTPFISTKDLSFRNLKQASKSDFAMRYLRLVKKYQKEGAVPELNVPKEVYDELVEAVDAITDATNESRAKTETPELQEVAADRDRIMQWLVRQTVQYKLWPLEAEQEAAQRLQPVAAPYAKFYDEPMGQRYALANGLLLDFRKPENKDYITQLGYEPYLAELEELNTRYATLKARRSEKRTKKTNSPTTAEINRRVENVIKVINSYADATVVLQPNEMAKKFVLEVNNLVEEIRLERRKKGKTEGD